MRSLKEIHERQISDCLKVTELEYRPYDPGKYLYIMFCKRDDLLSDEYIELMYVILVAWGMNSRGAQLNAFDSFRATLLENKDRIQKLRDQNICLETIDFDSKKEQIKELFTSLDLMKGGKTSRFVTYSKTLHLLLPNLCVPMDRKYTLSFYPSNVPKALDKQFIKYWMIMKDMQSYAKDHEKVLKQAIANKVDQPWNQNLTKVIDNILIGWNLKTKLK
ncbi:hypothetical protein [Sphaerochaeta halotolerans]|uniref:Uncharacterized protein n=1 Tax=Sphaerochaeta halotolerans TaxID=2293840 RepID=A0A372MEC8_9SPIR|nr:hypothetical protein [Sphaerochaeta halotolerans]MXI86947.1 hypothetical protein [Sphaerochaeta halotolerans]RFU93728.1 hypothetical protein DYP60_13235 [Sphaerochaeta halotolerans]